MSRLLIGNVSMDLNHMFPMGVEIGRGLGTELDSPW